MMAKDPAFLFYPNDWIGGTMGMTFEEKGAYMELLMMQFNRGHMSGHMIARTVGQLWDKIQDKFIQDADGNWYNERLEIEKEKRKTFTDSRKNNLTGNNQYTKKNGHMDGHTTSRMENVNEDVVVTKDKCIVDQEIFLDYCKQILGNEYPAMEFSLKAKYQQWKDDKWKDGFGNEIKNWKNKISNTIPHLKKKSPQPTKPIPATDNKHLFENSTIPK